MLHHYLSSDINCLSTLSKLEYLNLMGNKISHLSQLQSLRYFSKLRILKLQGNPVCLNVIDYPLEVFKMQSSIEQIDDW